VNTLETNLAKQLMELYISLKRNDQGRNERIKLLLELQETLKCFTQTDLTKPILNLLTRELTMLQIVKLNDNQLKFLRKRIEVEMQWILKQPDINPAIEKTLNYRHLIKCYNCRKLKSLNGFLVKSNLTKMITCKNCKYLHRITTERINLTPHDDMLKNIRATEAQLCAKSSLAFILNSEDIYYLVKIIWKGKSAISEFNDIIQLRLVRWCNKLDWPPTNTILLTIEEAYHHSKICDISKTYTPRFIGSIHLKHKIAKTYFKDLTEKTMKCDRNIEISKYTKNT